MADSQRIDRAITTALWTAILAITFSSAAITWSVSRVKTVEYQMAQLHEEVDVLGMRYQHLQATMEARNER